MGNDDDYIMDEKRIEAVRKEEENRPVEKKYGPVTIRKYKTRESYMKDLRERAEAAKKERESYEQEQAYKQEIERARRKKREVKTEKIRKVGRVIGRGLKGAADAARRNDVQLMYVNKPSKRYKRRSRRAPSKRRGPDVDFLGINTSYSKKKKKNQGLFGW